LRPRDVSAIPPDTAAIGQVVLRPSDPYRLIGEHLAEILQDAQFAALYEPTGRAALSPALLALVTLFQFQENLPDRDAARQVAVRLDWKYALHLPLDDPGFDFTDLHYFRQRLLAHDQERLVFETVLAAIKGFGLLGTHRKQRTDALAVLGAVADLSRLELVTETLRLVVRALEETDAAWAEREVPASFRERYARRQTDYQLTDAARTAALLEAGRDGVWLLARLDAAGSPSVRALAEIATLRTVWEQHYRVVDGALTLRVEAVNAKERIVTPHDPDVRVGEKRGKVWHGDKVHVTETTDDGEPRFLTDLTTANASSGDGEELPAIRAHLEASDLTPHEQNVDAGYISGKQLADSRAAGIELIGPALPDTSPNGFKIADFQIDRATKTATCPAGKAAIKWSARTTRDGSTAANIQFAAADCAGCAWRPQCTTSQTGRSLQLNEHYEILMARRADAETAEFRTQMHRRAGIEATLSELVRQHGLRHHRYRGAAKRVLENLLKGAACNLKRLARVLAARRGQPTATAAAPLHRPRYALDQPSFFSYAC